MRYFLFLIITLCGSLASASPKIVVVGAGLAGLTTAYRLQESGLPVEVYEARGRIGGRVFTITVNGQPCELGGQNIADGKEARNLLALVHELALQTEGHVSAIQLHYFENAEMKNVHRTIRERHFDPELLQLQLQNIGQHASNMREVLQALFDENDLLYKACSLLLSSYEGACVDKLSPIYIETLYHVLTGGISSAHPAGKDEARFEHLGIQGGNACLVETLAEKLHQPVHLNCVLKKIYKNASGRYILFFQNGERIETDYVVLTMPCLAYRDIEISESVIPQDTLQAIRNIQYGGNAKILLPIQPAQQSFGAHTNGRAITFLNQRSDTLIVYYADGYGSFTAATIDTTLKNELPMIKHVYTLANMAQPVAAADILFSCYECPVGHSWVSDPFAQGSYSCIGPGQEKLFTSVVEIEKEIVKTLFAPIDSSLFFAGEHTSILFDAIGTMEAAVESGERIARLMKKKLASKQM